MTKVGVLGAAGRMGQAVCGAVYADPALELVARVDPGVDGFADSPHALVDAEASVAVDFTRPDAVMDNVRFCIEHGIHVVVGTTGLSDADLTEIEQLTSSSAANVLVAPNFSIGAILMMHFANQAARYLGSCEIVELHHNDKLDAPSGTALRTARGVARVWEEHGRPPGGEAAEGEEETVTGARGAEVSEVRVHSLRLQGLVAHQEVVFGGVGQTLTIRHDSIDRSSFMPGVVMAVKAIADLRGLTVGLERLLDLEG
ncbi:MAG TPA: 4-hydroxy-tetrahydrodipicolinate reductase [Actinomycetota bacterium]|nr:4-hydroxy-tetrahydrodipicolinate reductase [Actinomycetota bacterium]